ncbi:peptidyl-prolyl cis-trans isomerase FKBP13, chloroplastic-like [Lycium barbarum]|uniref:peptidyl-prolyl cis-trans isomerase FKBP13, chloroplastic-like n=1 Tax=Lycium barbarum TaxID=112863 RepID=UPI00293EF0DD|nr:peptidyl-prolyl cis-trans isomerase FKBP13, chloroplastic-like [Lycium barbarum]
MNSVPLSIGTYIPTNHNTLKSLCIKNSQTTTNPIPHFTKLKETVSPLPCLFTRREALTALGLGFSATFFESNIEAFAAEEATTTECEFAVTPSGLAYCDKVVGYGPEAVKGQLIKK